jgi:hypothetical protein
MFFYIARLFNTYHIKLTGFEKKLTSDILSKMLNEKNCFVEPSQESIGYIGQIRSMKYAQRLLEKFHNKRVDGQSLQCQIELYQRSSGCKPSSRSGSMLNLAAKEVESPRFNRFRQGKNDSRNNSGRSSPARDDSDLERRAVDDDDDDDDDKFGQRRRSLSRSREDITKRKDDARIHKAKSDENLRLSANHECIYFIISFLVFYYNIFLAQSRNGVSENSRKVSKRDIKNDDTVAFLIEYDNADREIYEREWTVSQALTGKFTKEYKDKYIRFSLLVGVKGVLRLKKLNSESNDDEQRFDTKNHLSLITDYGPANTLKNFVKEIHRGGFRVLQAVQLVQILIKIIQKVHANGILHQNLGPESILIRWDWENNPANKAELVLTDFSHAHIKSKKNSRMNQSSLECWYKPPQADAESFRYTSTIDASSICAILLWLLTNTVPRHDQDILPHQQDNVKDQLDSKITHAVRDASM